MTYRAKNALKVIGFTLLLSIFASCDEDAIRKLDTEVQIQPTSVDFGKSFIGTVVWYPLEVFNVNPITVNLRGASTSSGFLVNIPGSEIESGKKQVILVGFAAYQEGLITGELVLKTDTTLTPIITIPLIGFGLQPLPPGLPLP